MDGVGLPGQGWTSVGNQSPDRTQQFLHSVLFRAKRGGLFNLLGIDHADALRWGLGLVLDTKGYEWNNKIQPRLGVKINKYFRKGVVSIGSAYSYEDRFKSFNSSGLTLFVQDWFGWQPVADKSSRFPGSSWIEVGNLSPVEHGNILGLGYISQGVVAKRFRKATLVPYVEATVFRDSQGYDWDNRATVGGGVKAVIPRDQIYTEVGVAYLHENRFQSGLAAGGLTVFTNFSFNWNLLGRKVGR